MMKKLVVIFVLLTQFFITAKAQGKGDENPILPPLDLKAVPADYNCLLTVNISELANNELFTEIKGDLINSLKKELDESQQMIAIAKAVGFNEENIQALHVALKMPEKKASNDKIEYNSEDENFLVFLEFKNSVDLEMIVDLAMRTEKKKDLFSVEMVGGLLCFGDKEGEVIAYQASENCIAILSPDHLKDILKTKSKSFYDNKNIQELYKKSRGKAISIVAFKEENEGSIKNFSGFFSFIDSQVLAQLQLRYDKKDEANAIFSQIELYSSVLKQDKKMEKYLENFTSELVDNTINLKLSIHEETLKSLVDMENDSFKFSIDVNTDAKDEKNPENKQPTKE